MTPPWWSPCSLEFIRCRWLGWVRLRVLPWWKFTSCVELTNILVLWDQLKHHFHTSLDGHLRHVFLRLNGGLCISPHLSQHRPRTRGLCVGGLHNFHRLAHRNAQCLCQYLRFLLCGCRSVGQRLQAHFPFVVSDKREPYDGNVFVIQKFIGQPAYVLEVRHGDAGRQNDCVSNQHLPLALPIVFSILLRSEEHTSELQSL